MKKGIILGLALVLVLSGCSTAEQNKSDVVKNALSFDSAKAKAEEFINKNMLSANSPSQAKVTKIEEEGQLFKMKIQVGSQSIDSYMTQDGKQFFPQALGMNKQEGGGDNSQAKADNNATRKVTVNTKKETPQVELFVMAYCPYGTQMEKAVLPVVKTLGDKIEFDLKFCDYAMHDKKELQEQMAQYCIQEEQPSKLISYLDCFLESSDSETCLQEAGVNQSLLDSCVSRVDQEYSVMANYEDKSTWRGRFPTFKVHEDDNKKYGISGSPGLVINGEKVQAPRNPNSLLDTICSAFQEKPEECDQELTTSSPSPGFGSGSGGGSAGSCG